VPRRSLPRPEPAVDVLDLLAEAVAERVADKLAGALLQHHVGAVADTQSVGYAPSPWLDAKGAADHLRCPLSRVRKLTSAGSLPVHREGRRVLYRRDELDAYVLTDEESR
jgi:excisionase family DNA binding protein